MEGIKTQNSAILDAKGCCKATGSKPNVFSFVMHFLISETADQLETKERDGGTV